MKNGKWKYGSKTQKILDKQIMRISERSDILRFLDPVNKFEELQHFLDARGNYNPQFKYDNKHIPILKEVLEYIGKLKNRCSKLRAKIGERGYELKLLMAEKCEELECKFKLLEAYHDQNMENIQKYNEQLFGTRNHQTINSIEEQAHSLEKKYDLDLRSMLPGYNLPETLSRKQVLHLVEFHLQKNNIHKYSIKFGKYGNTNMQVSIGPKPTIYINKKTSYSLFDTSVSILHEIYGHLARYSNGIESEIHILQGGTAYYLSTEEGVAVFQAARLEGITKTIHRLHDNYNLIYEASQNNWSQLTKKLLSKGRNNLEYIYRSILRLKRGLVDTSKSGPGIVFYKDKVYWDGYCEVIGFLSKPATRIDSLMQGRLKIDDISS